MKKVGIIQSNYIPWCGYFDIISSCDEFVFLDDVQFTKNDWRNRNKIKTSSGAQWLSIPCGKNISRTIDEVVVSDAVWAAKHWKTISQNYSGAPYFDEFSHLFQALYHSWQMPVFLSEVNQSMIKFISHEILGLNCKFHSSRELNLQGDRVERLADMVQQLDGTHYISGPAAKSYLDVKVFEKREIDVIFAHYPDYGPYTQQFGSFISNLSIIDAIFHLGHDVRSLFGCVAIAD